VVTGHASVKAGSCRCTKAYPSRLSRVDQDLTTVRRRVAFMAVVQEA
jgi:hypothetical protein